MKKIILAALLITTPAIAQAPQEYTFKITGPEVDVIAKGLESQPYKDVVPLLQKLREQFVAQQPKPEPLTGKEQIPIPKPAPKAEE